MQSCCRAVAHGPPAFTSRHQGCCKQMQCSPLRGVSPLASSTVTCRLERCSFRECLSMMPSARECATSWDWLASCSSVALALAVHWQHVQHHAQPEVRSDHLSLHVGCSVTHAELANSVQDCLQLRQQQVCGDPLLWGHKTDARQACSVLQEARGQQACCTSQKQTKLAETEPASLVNYSR